MKKVQNSGESANTRRRKMQNTVGHSGERQYNRAKVGKWMPGKGSKLRREGKRKDANTMKRSSGVRKRIRAKDAKYRSRGQARGGKDKGFGEQKGKIQSCQAMQIQLQAPIQAIQHQASPGEGSFSYRRPATQAAPESSVGVQKIAAPQFHALSPTALLGVALSGLTNVDRTGNSIFHLIWPQPKVSFAAA